MKKNKTSFLNLGLLKSRKFMLLFLMILFSGAMLKADPIAEGFNSWAIQSYNGTFEWNGWKFDNGRGYSLHKYEGTHSVAVSGSLTSPEKTGGVGVISFMYRTELAETDVDVVIQTSEDGITWNNEDTFTANGTVFQNKSCIVNNATAKYIKIDMSNNKSLLIDAVVITDNNTLVAEFDIAAEHIFGFEDFPAVGSIPMTFTNISSDVTLATSKATDITLGKETLTSSEANGLYNLSVSLNPADQSINAFYSTLTVSGGGIPFSSTVPVYFYRMQESSFEDFDIAFTNAATGAAATYFTNSGWLVKGGSRYTYDSKYIGFGSPASVSLSSYSSTSLAALSSPMMKSGIGTVQFYIHTGSNTSNTISLPVYISSNGVDWTLKETVSVTPTINVFKPFDVVINDATAKFVKIELSSGSCYIENLAVTKNGVAIPKVSFNAEEPYFATNAGNEQIANVVIKGENIVSDLTVEFATGGVFSSDVTTIQASDINNKTYTIPVKFNPTSDYNHFTDNIKLLGANSQLIQSLSIEGYSLKDLLADQFNTTASFPELPGVANVYMYNGWKIFNGVKASGSSFSNGVSYPNYVSSPSAIQLNSGTSINGRLLSPPKSNGVGTIQFYYRNSTASNINYNPELKLRTYKNLTEAPVEIETITVPLFSESSDFTLYTVEINDAEAQYVEIFLEMAPLGNFGVLIDDMIITAAGKDVPVTSLPEKITLTTYPKESFVYDLEIEMENVYGNLTLAMEKGDNFTFTPAEITPVDGVVSVTGQITYNPSDTEFMSSDNIIIKGEGLISTINIPVFGHKLESTISQDFNTSTGWSSTEGTYVLDGWEMTYASRVTNPTWINGVSGLSLGYGPTKDGILISPEKAGGIKNISFVYYAAYPHNLVVETSNDGNKWEEVFSEETEFGAKEPVDIPVNKPNAKYARFYMKHQFTTGNNYSIYLDDIVITGLPYLRQVGATDAVVTNTVPVNIPVEIAGVLDADATIAMLKAGESKFTPSATTITAADLLESGEPKNFSFNLSFTAEESGVYQDTIVITDASSAEYLRIPVEVTLNKPYLELLGTVDPVVSTEVPVEIPIEVKGLLTSNVTIQLTGTNAENFSLGKTSITPEELKSGSVYFDVTFTSDESGEYNANVVFGDYLTVPVKVTYNKPYIELVGTVDPVQTTEVPVSIPIEVKGFLAENATISLTGQDAANFQLSKTSFTPADLEEKTVKFTATFSLDTKGIYNANVVISDSKRDYITIPISVDYTPSGIGENGVDAMSVSISKEGILYVRNAEVGSSLTVYSLDGQSQMNALIKAEQDSFILGLEKGIYIVTIGNNNFKVIYK